MYVVTLTYTAPLEQIDALVPAHREWLDRNYTDGVFLASGAQIPRVGGVVLARAESRAALDEVLAGDPFRVGGVATYQVVEFTATKTAPELAFLKE